MASNSFIPIFRNENGKRERMDQEDDPDVLPLSKRMNNIHFDGGLRPMESHSSSQAHASYNGIQNGFPHPSHAQQGQSFSHPQAAENGTGMGNGVSRGNDNHLLNYSNGHGDGQGHSGFSSMPNGINGYIKNPIREFQRERVSNGNFEERLHDPSVQVPSLNKIEYSPVLDQESNPFYYEQNRILFELYKERLERNNLPAHPNYGSN